LGVLRRFADRISWLFDTPKDYHQASCRRAKIVRDPDFQAVPEWSKALEQLDESKFPKIMAYLKNPLSVGCGPTITWSGPTGYSVPGERCGTNGGGGRRWSVRGDETRHHLDDWSPPRPSQVRPPAETGQARNHNGMTDYNHVRSREIAVVLSEKCPYSS